MERKVYQILCAFLTVSCLAFYSCADANPDIVPSIDSHNEENAYFSISLSALYSPTTKGPIDEIIPWENRVNEVWILLYNEKSILEYKFILKIQNYKTETPSQLNTFTNTEEEVILKDKATDLKFQSIAKSIKRQQYKMAVLANPSSSIPKVMDIEEGSKLSDLTSAINSEQGEIRMDMFGSYEGEQKSTLFFMSNANGLTTVTPSKLQPTVEKAHENPIEVNIERLLAKVVVKENPKGVTLNPKEVILDKTRPIKWYTDVTNRSTFLIRQFAHLAGGSIPEDEMNSPKDRKDVYARDPNFELIENDKNQFKKWNRSEEIPYATWISSAPSSSNLRTYQYVLENTFDPETQGSDNRADFATNVTLEAYLIYTDLLWDKNEPENEADPNRNYYSCYLKNDSGETDWRVFTQEQIAHWMDRGFPYVEEKESETPAETAKKESENAWIKLLEEKTKKIQKDYDRNAIGGPFNFSTSDHPGTTADKYHTYDNVTYHPLGLNIYTIPIRHFGTFSGSTIADYGYYGVVRNNMYTVTINSINAPGSAFNDWDNRFISVSISITPWYRRVQGTDLQYDE